MGMINLPSSSSSRNNRRSSRKLKESNSSDGNKLNEKNKDPELRERRSHEIKPDKPFENDNNEFSI